MSGQSSGAKPAGVSAASKTAAGAPSRAEPGAAGGSPAPANTAAGAAGSFTGSANPPAPSPHASAAAEGPDDTVTGPVKVIKRYANRKLYDTERSCYVTLDEIAVMIKHGEDVKVVDNKTKDDLTAVTLAQIIVEEEKKVQKMPLKVLRGIIQSGNDALGGFFEKRVEGPVRTLRDDVERRVDALLRRDVAKEPAAAKEAAGKDPAAKDPASHESEMRPSVIQEFVSSSTEAFDAWQRRIDERVREGFGKLGHRADVDALQARIAQLEARLAELEKPQ